MSGYRDENYIKWSGDGIVLCDDVMFWVSLDDLQSFLKFIVYKYLGKVKYKIISLIYVYFFVGVIYIVFIVYLYLFLQYYFKSMYGE